jgi:hypothetical protein
MSSVVGYLGKQTNWNEDVYGQQTQQNREAQWGPIPGEIVSYDAATQTATVKPLYKPLQNGEPVEMAQLFEVPVEFPRSGNSAITHPVPAGTKVMLNPSMRSTEKYHDEDDGSPSDTRSFHLSDMRASLVGGDSLTDPLPNVDPDNTHLRFDAQGHYGLKGSPDGKVRLDGSQGNIYDLLAQVVELLAADTLEIKYGSSAGSGHALQFQAQYADIAAKLRAMAL